MDVPPCLEVGLAFNERFVFQITVNAVCPGIVETPMIHESGEGGIASWLRPFVDSIERLRPEEIAEAVVALVRDDGKIGEVVSVENQPRA